MPDEYDEVKQIISNCYNVNDEAMANGSIQDIYGSSEHQYSFNGVYYSDEKHYPEEVQDEYLKEYELADWRYN